MGHLREVKIQVKVCPKCRRAFYPEFYQNGLIFVHNKFLITIEAILDLNHVLQTGGNFIETVKKKFLLLGQLEGLEKETTERDLANNAVKLEKTVIAIMSLLVTGSDWDGAVCYICGICPKIVCTDGNTKVRILCKTRFHSGHIPIWSSFIDGKLQLQVATRTEFAILFFLAPESSSTFLTY